MEAFDEIEVYVAIADYTPEEESNIPLYSGQHVQVCLSVCLYVFVLQLYICVCLYVCVSV